MHLECGYGNPLINNWSIDILMKGVARDLGLAVERKLPITPDLLLFLYTSLNNSVFDRVFWAACLFLFFTFLRKSNVFPLSSNSFNPSRHLTRGDILISPKGAQDGVFARVKWSKTIQFKDRIVLSPLPLLNDHPLCPVSALITALEVFPNSPLSAPLFLVPDKSASATPLLYRQFINYLHTKLTSLGFQAKSYSGHSFRRGGASWALAQGIPKELIKVLGDWKSDAVDNYFEIQHETKLAISHQFSANLPSHYTHTNKN